ncbi:hypothetical protein I6E68_04880 [Salinibacterium sp. NSLL150]|uniref:hypothetical protein n=1 Tax=unclassified Salinibacterium TaxID=2632331 RepID=UPI0018CF7271|nr:MULTISPECIES: hypothetical protein [unclassified Salinibacterium]MBH0098475.1 hypothetical protein [Salinibacterium sp. NSLL35]MBH0101230.1 hypothetical protein [Salinibacterium sp. NSLL150]MBH0103989.1 hypothetical protein [Salinibacterium sp. NSLL16]MBH0106750.1 hypothetical protein [Salinibacterium sp. NSLL17]
MTDSTHPEQSGAPASDRASEGEQCSAAGAEQSGEPRAKPTKRRRVTTAPPAGSDPHPPAEPERHQVNENDERLKGDKPPHWG